MKRTAPAVARNSSPIADVLAHELQPEGLVLEVASGTGEHAVFMARRFPGIRWQPSDPDLDALASVAAWREEAGLANLLAPLKIDASAQDWPVSRTEAIVCINMVHISPWEATIGLFAGAARLLGEGEPLILYGPYLEDEVETTGSNVAFDQSLKSRDPAWGLRHTRDMDALALAHGLTRTARHAMPANNLVLVYRRT